MYSDISKRSSSTPITLASWRVTSVLPTPVGPANRKEPIVFVTHGPPKSRTKIDFVPGVGHVGDKNLSDILNYEKLKNILNVHGHIHEGGGSSATYNSNQAFNIAAIGSYNNPGESRTSLLSIKDGKIIVKKIK